MSQNQQDPDFSQEAARVVHSPYFDFSKQPNPPIPEGDREARIAWSDQLQHELDSLKAAVQKARTYKDLSPEMKALYDKAAHEVMVWDELRARAEESNWR